MTDSTLASDSVPHLAYLQAIGRPNLPGNDLRAECGNCDWYGDTFRTRPPAVLQLVEHERDTAQAAYDSLNAQVDGAATSAGGGDHGYQTLDLGATWSEPTAPALVESYAVRAFTRPLPCGPTCRCLLCSDTRRAIGAVIVEPDPWDLVGVRWQR